MSSAASLEGGPGRRAGLSGPEAPDVELRGDAAWSSADDAQTAWTIGGPARLDQAASAWDSLSIQVDSPMQHYIWTKSCLEAFGGADRLQLIDVRPAPSSLGIAALVRPELGPARLEMPGVRDLGEPADLVYTDRYALNALCRALVQLGVPVHLARVPADSPTTAALVQAYRGRGIVLCRPASACPAIALDASWIDPEQRFSARRRSDLRRALRKAEKLGPVSFEIQSPGHDEVDRLLEEAFRVEEASWKGHEGTALSCDAARGAFFRKYAAAAARKGILRLCFLRIGGRAAAMQIAAECGKRFWVFKIGYDEEFAACSPGMLLLLETVRDSARRGLRSYELLGGVAPWTQAWTRLERPCVSLHAYPATAQGVSQLAARAAWSLWQRMRRAA